MERLDEMNIFSENKEKSKVSLNEVELKYIVDISKDFYNLLIKTEGECPTYSEFLKNHGISGTLVIDFTDDENKNIFKNLKLIFMESDLQISLKTHPTCKIPAEVVIQVRTKGVFKKHIEETVLFEAASRYINLDDVTKVYMNI